MNLAEVDPFYIALIIFSLLNVAYFIAKRGIKKLSYFDYIGDCLFVFTAGISIYAMPYLLYGITYQNINAILSADDVNAIQELLKQYGLIEETAKEIVQDMKIKSIIIGIIIGVFTLFSLIAKSQIRQKKNFENKNTTQIGNING